MHSMKNSILFILTILATGVCAQTDNPLWIAYQKAVSNGYLTNQLFPITLTIPDHSANEWVYSVNGGMLPVFARIFRKKYSIS